MTHKDFEEDLDSLSQVTLDNLKLAAEEDLQKKPITEPNVHKLMKHLKVTAGRVLGTNQSQASIWSKIWSQCIKFGPPSLWLTINPSDLHNPITQVFCREEINLDKFERTSGPNVTH